MSETLLVIDGATVELLLRSPSGPVVKWLIERATVVQFASQRQVGVQTGRLRRSIGKRIVFEDGEPNVLVGTDTVPYALLHHEGTAPHEIWPKRPDGVLRFEMPRGSGNVVFARMVNHPGTKPNHYLSDVLPLAIADSGGSSS